MGINECLLLQPKATEVAVKCFAHVMREWQLNEKEQLTLLGIPGSDQDGETSSIMSKAVDKKTLPLDALNRISRVIGLYRSLHSIFPNRTQANAWMSRVNNTFNGVSALKFVLQDPENNLPVVSAYLDEQLFR